MRRRTIPPNPSGTGTGSCNSATLISTGAGLVLYAGLWFATAKAFGVDPARFVVFAPVELPSSFATALPQLALAVIGTGLALFAPGALANAVLARLSSRWHARSIQLDATESVLLAFVLSMLILVATIVLLGGSQTIRIGRESALVVCFATGMGLLVLAYRGSRVRGGTASDGVVVLLAILLVAVLVLMLREQLAIQNFSDDEQEAVEYALSLRFGGLPQWEVPGGWGVVPNFMLFAYPIHALMLALGESEFAARMLFFGALFATVIGLAALLRSAMQRPLRTHEVAVLFAAAVVTTTIAVFYSSWHPFIVGPAEPSGVDMLGLALFVAATHFLLSGRSGLFLLAALLSHAALPSGAVFGVTLLALAALLPELRGRVARLAPLYIAAAAAWYAILLRVGAGNAGLGAEYSPIEMTSYFSGLGDIGDAGRFVLVMLVASAGCLPVALLALRRGMRTRAGVLALFVLLHTTAGVLFVELRHVHYHLGVALLACAVALLSLERARPRAGWGLAAIGVVVALMLLLPVDIRPETNARRLGNATRFECSVTDLPTLYSATTPFGELVSWKEEGISLPNWLYYAMRSAPRSEPDLIVADPENPVPEGYREHARTSSCSLAVREGFDRQSYAPTGSYRDLPAWRVFGVTRWREHFR